MPRNPNWRTDPQIQAVKDLCERFAWASAFVVGFRLDGRTVMASYGTNGELCSETGAIAELVIEAIEGGDIWSESLGEALEEAATKVVQ